MSESVSESGFDFSDFREQSRAEQSRAEQSKAEHRDSDLDLG